MVIRLSSLVFTFLAAQCLGQDKDLVYGGLAPHELVSAIKFVSSKSPGEFIKIDNMGNGDPFALVITYEKVESISSIRSEDTVRISQTFFNCLFKIIVSDSVMLGSKMTTTCGTFRFVCYDGVRPKIFFANGYRFSRGYFDTLTKTAEICGNEPAALRRLENIVRAFQLGMISECR